MKGPGQRILTLRALAEDIFICPFQSVLSGISKVAIFVVTPSL